MDTIDLTQARQLAQAGAIWQAKIVASDQLGGGWQLVLQVKLREGMRECILTKGRSTEPRSWQQVVRVLRLCHEDLQLSEVTVNMDAWTEYQQWAATW